MLNFRPVFRGCKIAVFIPVLHALTLADSRAVEGFYAGKQVVINVGSAPGGGYDAQARLMARHIARFIPGQPNVIVQNRPGAGGLVAANYIFNVAPKDGTVFALLQRTVVTAKQLVPDNVQFDAAKFNWLGSLASEPGVLVASRSSPVATAKDLMSKQLIVGGAGVANDSELTPKVLNAVLGTKLKIVSGYRSVGAVALAIERGEVEGLVDWSWSNVKRSPRFFKGDLARVVMQFGLERLGELKEVPTPIDFTTTAADKILLALYLAPKAVARPVALPPGVPEDRVAAIQKAFMEMTRDPAFLADAEKIGSPIDAVDGGAVRGVIDVVTSAPRDVVDRLRAIMAER